MRFILAVPLLASVAVCCSPSFQAAAAEMDQDITVSLRSHQAQLLPDLAAARRRWYERAVSCGPEALLMALGAAGINPAKADSERITASAGMTGTNLLELKRLAESVGAHTKGVSGSWNALAGFEVPAVAYLNTGTFVAVLPRAGKELSIVPPLNRRVISVDDDFRSRYGDSVQALLVSSQPFQSSQLRNLRSTTRQSAESVLTINPSMVPLGLLHDAKWNAEVTVHNSSAEAVELLGVTTSCGCVEATVDQRILLPDQSTTIRITGEQPRVGLFAYTVTLATSLDDGVFQIPVHGLLDSPFLLSNYAILLRDVIAGETAVVDVPFETLIPLHSDQIRVTTPPQSPLSGDVHVQEDGTLVARLIWTGANADPGWHAYELQIVDGGNLASVPAHFSLTVEVVSPLKAFPASLTIRRHDLEHGWNRRIVFEPKQFGEDEFNVDWADGTTESIRKIPLPVTTISPGRHVVQIDADLNIDSASMSRHGDIGGAVVIATTRGEEVRIPVFLRDRPMARQSN